jgi:hypothetical protein
MTEFIGKLSNRQKILFGGFGIGLFLYSMKKKTVPKEEENISREKKQTSKFVPQLKKLLKIVIPSIRSKEMALLILHTMVK